MPHGINAAVGLTISREKLFPLLTNKKTLKLIGSKMKEGLNCFERFSLKYVENIEGVRPGEPSKQQSIF